VARVVRWAGAGAELWRVRVDLFAAPPQPHHVQAAERKAAEPRQFGWTHLSSPVVHQMESVYARLKEQLTTSDSDTVTDRGDIGIDQGTGAAGRDVIGMLFWVRADDVGRAAMTAVAVARSAGEQDGVGPELYDVTVIPRAAVSLPGDPSYPPMPD
jgi:hypothetical protein